MNRCKDCKYYRNNYDHGQCFAQKNAPRVDYAYACENFKSKTEDKFGKIDEIVSEYITNSDYNACDAMEDIIQVLDEQEPHYYNKIKEKNNE